MLSRSKSLAAFVLLIFKFASTFGLNDCKMMYVVDRFLLGVFQGIMLLCLLIINQNVVVESFAADEVSLASLPRSEQFFRVRQEKPRLFNTVELRRPLASLPQWLNLLERNRAKPIFVQGKRFGKFGTWDEFRAGALGKQGLDLLRYVQNFWNSWPYRNDLANWGVHDYWASPDEFLARSGDCEDYAIIKYFTLKALGYPPNLMRIVFVQDTRRNLGHAVLAVYLAGEIYILDNVQSMVLKQKHFKHYRPQASFNEFGRWVHIHGRKITATAAGK